LICNAIWAPKEGEPYNRPQAVAFPLSSRFLLYLFPIESIDLIARNCFVKLTHNYINDLYGNISACARQWIYSRNALTEDQLKIIAEARNGQGKLKQQ